MVNVIKALMQGGVVAAGLLLSAASSAEIVFEDDFESGDLSKVVNGSSWVGKARVSVTDENPLTGAYAARLTYPAKARNSFSELRFHMGKKLKEVWIRYDLFVPSNYRHQMEGKGSHNNKGLIYLWGNTYNKPSASTAFNFWPSLLRVDHQAHDKGDSFLTLTRLRNGRPAGHKWAQNQGRNYTTIIDTGEDTDHDPDTVNDLGKWMSIYINVSISDFDPYGDGKTGNAHAGVWKCHSPCSFDDLTPDNALFYYRNLDNWVAEDAYFDNGYILGWANSGFAEETVFYLDNVIVADEKQDILGKLAAPRLNPLPPRFESGEWVKP